MDLYYGLDNGETWGDIECLLGYLGLRNGDSVLEEHDIFLDSWFAALIQGLQAAEEGRWGPIEIWEEPQLLVFEPEEEGFRISYGDESVKIPDTKALREVLTKTSRTFFDDAEEKVDIRDTDPLAVIRRFLNPQWNW